MTDVSKTTLYSGGHKGAEAEFGKLAEAWKISEVNFSFEGHTPERTRGVRVLGQDELQKGDVSMEIVSKRMNRTYSKTDKIRKVIQSIFHMINNGYHVIAVGWIQAPPVAPSRPDLSAPSRPAGNDRKAPGSSS